MGDPLDEDLEERGAGDAQPGDRPGGVGDLLRVEGRDFVAVYRLPRQGPQEWLVADRQLCEGPREVGQVLGQEAPQEPGLRRMVRDGGLGWGKGQDKASGGCRRQILGTGRGGA